MDSRNGGTLHIGIDVGGTKIAGVAYTNEGTHQHPQVDVIAQCEVPARAGSQALIDDIMTVITYLLNDAHTQYTINSNEHYQLASIGIGTPGVVNTTTGHVNNIANLLIDHIDLGPQIAQRTGVPVVVENDVNAAALGAAALNNASGIVVYLNLGTGLGAGIIRNGALDRGSSGNAGEIGHIPVEPHAYRCGCGQYGCLETVASGGAARKLWPYDDPPMPAIIAQAHDPQAAQHEQAQEVLTTICTAIANAIMALAITVDPNTIIIGGGMARTGEPLLEQIRSIFIQRGEDSDFVHSMQLGSRLVLADMTQPIASIGAGLAAEQALSPSMP